VKLKERRQGGKTSKHVELYICAIGTLQLGCQKDFASAESCQNERHALTERFLKHVRLLDKIKDKKVP